jgi:hypothetical protein
VQRDGAVDEFEAPIQFTELDQRVAEPAEEHRPVREVGGALLQHLLVAGYASAEQLSAAVLLVPSEFGVMCRSTDRA